MEGGLWSMIIRVNNNMPIKKLMRGLDLKQGGVQILSIERWTRVWTFSFIH